MKKTLFDAAKQLDCHPAELMVRLAGMGAPYEECWPELQQKWQDKLMQDEDAPDASEDSDRPALRFRDGDAMPEEKQNGVVAETAESAS